MIVDKRARFIRWMPIVLPVVLSLALSSAYLALVLEVGGGRPIAPLDDSYIFFQYARQIARGHPWQYNDGDPPSRGMSSLLYPWMLAAWYKLGVQGERLVWVALLGGVLWLTGMAVVAGRIWEALDLPGSRPLVWQTLAGVAVPLTGILQWSSFTGMETGLLALLILLALNALLRRHHRRAALWLSLAGLTRTEGLILSAVTWLAFWLAALLDLQPGVRPRLSPALDRRRLWQAFLRTCPFGVALLAGLMPTVANWVMTGSTTPAGLEAKAWFYNVPRIRGDIVRSIAVSYRRVLIFVLNGWREAETGGYLVAHSLSVMALVGWIVLAVRRRWIALLGAAWFIVGTLSTATLITATWHLGRYQAPFVPLAVLAALAAMQFLWEKGSLLAAEAVSQGTPSRLTRLLPHLARLVSGAMLIWFGVTSLRSTGYAFSAARRTLHTIAGQQLALADWVDAHLPQDARVGVHDTGALCYVGQRATYDLVGLTTARATLAWRHGSGSVYEAMESAPARPDYFALYPDVLAIPYLRDTDLFGQELFAVRVKDYVVTSASSVQKVWRADWRLARSGDAIVQRDILTRIEGLVLVDALDVADLEDEARHNLEWWHGPRYIGFPTEVHQQRHRAPPEAEVLEGGRLVSGGVAFQVDTRPGQPLWIAARLHPAQAGATRVIVDGRDVGRWAFPSLPGAWLETLYRIPADAITEAETLIRLELDPDVPQKWLNPTQDWQHYAPYHYWFFQGEPERAFTPISRPMDVTYGRGLRLLGFDLQDERPAPGQDLSVTLYWTTDVLLQSAARVFVHLYDAQGDLGPQSDGWPVSGTRPPYTWQPGEMVVDRRAIPLPADLPPGQYALHVGLYEASGRLEPHTDAAVSPTEAQIWAEKRVPLGYVDVGQNH